MLCGNGDGVVRVSGEGQCRGQACNACTDLVCEYGTSNGEEVNTDPTTTIALSAIFLLTKILTIVTMVTMDHQWSQPSRIKPPPAGKVSDLASCNLTCFATPYSQSSTTGTAPTIARDTFTTNIVCPKISTSNKESTHQLKASRSNTINQSPIMVRRPKAVWPGLDRMDLQRKMIAGDGNCLFASLADQLYGSAARHHEIRAAIIQHMRAYRPLFENVAIKDDIQQKRATRAQTNAIRTAHSDDNFEEYLTIMSKPGTYGGEPELVAFVQSFDQDVLIHLPRMEGYPESIPYINQYRPVTVVAKPTLHLCYGGDETTNAHYDSVRRNNPVVPIMQCSDAIVREVSPTSSVASGPKTLTARAIRNSRSDISKDMMHELVVRGTTDLRYALDHLNDSERARSPSASSSHNSNSSKRSLDDDGESLRSTKRADRRKSTRGRNALEKLPSSLPTAAIKVKLNTGLATPASTQDSEFSSDQSDRESDIDRVKLRPRRKLVSRSLTPDVGIHTHDYPRRGSTTLTQSISASEPINSLAGEQDIHVLPA